MNKKTLLSFFFVFFALKAYSYSFGSGGIFYNITNSTNLTVEVTHGNELGGYFGVVTIPQTVSYNGVYYTVTGVGEKAFSACSGLTKVNFPQTVTTIGDYAFSGCNAMMEIVIPATITKIGNYVFSGCYKLSSIQFEFGKTLLALGKGSSKGSKSGLFYDCPIKSITLTRGFSILTPTSDNGYSPFANHPTIESVIYKNWTNTGSYLFYGCPNLSSVTFPDFLNTINDYSFAGCKSLKSIDIPAKVTTIGDGAFRNCSGFKTFTISSGVTSIGQYCFAGCIGLTSFTFPVNLTNIGNYAFSGCTSIKELVFEHGGNDNLTIGSGASNKLSNSIFYDCPLESVTLGRGLHYSTSKDYGYSPFANHPTLKSFTFYHLKNTGEYLLYSCSKLTSVNLGNMVRIDDYAFANCNSLSAIDIPATITTLGNSAFRNCNWFNSFKIGTGVEEIGDYCFAGCISLDDITIPGNVTSIGNYAFLNCTQIKKVAIEKGSTVLSMGYGASKGKNKGLFDDCPLESVTICRDLNYSTSKDYGYSPFAYNSTLTTATYGDGATKMTQYMFCGDASLSSVTMTKDMTAIGKCALYDCVGIKSFVMGVKNAAGDVLYSSVETIGDYAFSGCTNLTGLIFPPTLKSIGNYAFRNCTSFTNFAMEEGTEVLSLGNGSSEGEKTGLFRDCPINDVFIGRNLSYSYSPLSNIATLTEAKIGNPVIRIPNYIFQGDTGLTTLHFNQSCKLSAIGKYAFAGCTKLPPYEFPETLITIDEGAFQNCVGLNSFVLGENVETIGAYAFDGCKQLPGLIFPSSLKSIGNYAFRNCTSFNNFTFEESEETLTLGNGSSAGEKTALFRDCPIKKVFIGRNLSYSYAPLYGVASLTEAGFGNPVTRIPNYILQNASELNSVYFNKSCKVTAVGKYAFDGCSKLPKLDLPESITTYDEGAFRGCTGITSFIIPSTVTNIGNYVFNNCTSLATVVIEDGGETLTLGYNGDSGDDNKNGKGLFYDCPLVSVYIDRPLSYKPQSRYGNSPFARITSLKKFQMGENVVTLNSQYLRECTGIEEISVPESVTSLELSAFYGCSGLKSITLSPNLKTIANYVFYGCTSLTRMTIPASVTSIGNYAFGSCTNLSKLFIKDGDQTLSLGYGASQGEAYGLFYDCPLESLYLGRTLSYTGNSKYGYSPFAKQNLLSEVTIGPQVTALGWSVFHSCPSITELYIPSSVRKIDSSFSWNCSGLKKVIILGSTPPTTDTSNALLYGTGENCLFYVMNPDKYKLANVWKNYADKIEACCEIYSNFTYSGDGHVIGYQTDFPIVLDNRDTEAIDAGTYQKRIEVTYQTNGYSINDILNYEYTIKKAPLTIAARSCSRYFGKENPEFKVKYQGFVNDEDEKALTKEPIVTTKATNSSPAGEYDIIVSGAEAKNYEISYVSGTLTILPTPVGDLNGDDKVDKTDLSLLVDYIMGKNPLGIDKNTADVNKDGKVNAADVTKVVDIIKTQAKK